MIVGRLELVEIVAHTEGDRCDDIVAAEIGDVYRTHVNTLRFVSTTLPRCCSQ
jgi:hypothetical protein